MALLKAEHITKTYGQRTIIKDINIELHQGELVCLLGVSGSGKTTLFHILSGLTTPDEGHVYLNDRDITSTPGQISYMLQKDLLLPHKKIIDNVSLPLILKGMKKTEARAKADPLFAEFGLDGTQYQYRRHAPACRTVADLSVVQWCRTAGRTIFRAGYYHKIQHPQMVPEHHDAYRPVHAFYHP